AVDTPQNPDTSWVRSETPVKREVRRQTPDGERVFRLRTVPVPSPDNDHEQFGLYIDITDQRRRQRTLERLYQTVQEFFDAPDRETVCRRAVKAAAEVLDFSTCGVHLYDRETEGLEPVATTGVSDAFDEETDAPTYTDPDTVVWEAYRTGEPVVIADTETFAGQLPDEDTPVRSALVLPLGNHGVFITSSRTPNAFDESDQYFGKLLGRMLQTALDRTEREQSLQSVQSATRSLVTASDAEAIAESLVTRAAETISAPYVAVWRHEPGERLLRPVAQTAVAAELFERAPAFGPGDSIAWEVFREGEARLVDHVAAAEAAYDRDSPMQSEIIVPLGSYGVLTAGSKLTNDFSQEEFELLQTLATSAESALQIVGKQRELDVLDEVLARILRHNVRNDLNVIRGRAGIIVDTGPPDCVDHAESIVETADKILSTAANATEIREVVDRRDEYRTMRVDDVIRSAVSEVREEYTGATVAVEELPSTELAVHPHFEYAVRHAVENGIEHDDSDEPRVEVRAAALDNGAVIEVEDDGPGIPESEIEPLVAGEETRLVHGSGAGLWILDR
ncbi:MAG: GAF domain-containing protein, partial [Halobaculum sp.]